MKNGKLFSNFQKGIPVILAGVLLFGCKDQKTDNMKVDFDRQAMLKNWADNIIIPAYSDFENQVTSFSESVDSLSNNANVARLTKVRNDFRKLHLAFQRIKTFELGPAASISFKASVNTYPADTARILANIQQGSYDLGSASNIDAKGLPALDYLLYGIDDQLIQDANTMQYLQDCLADIETLTSSVTTGWETYRDDFISADGTDIGSSMGLMVNSLNKDYELVKNAKIGFPAGKKTLGQTYPKACEAYYSGLSLELAEENTRSIYKLFRGMHYDGNGKGPSLKDYLQELNVQQENHPLDEAIDDQFKDALQAIANVPATLSKAVDYHKAEVDKAYLEVQKNVVLLKVDMPSALGVLITYQDNDGD